MLSNVRVFLHGAKVNVLENLLNISLTVECVLIVATCHKNHKSISGEQVSGKISKFHTFSTSCNNDKLYCQGKHLFLDCFLFLSFTGHKCRNGSSNKIWQMLQNVNKPHMFLNITQTLCSYDQSTSFWRVFQNRMKIIFRIPSTTW